MGFPCIRCDYYVKSYRNDATQASRIVPIIISRCFSRTLVANLTN